MGRARGCWVKLGELMVLLASASMDTLRFEKLSDEMLFLQMTRGEIVKDSF